MTGRLIAIVALAIAAVIGMVIMGKLADGKDAAPEKKD